MKIVQQTHFRMLASAALFLASFCFPPAMSAQTYQVIDNFFGQLPALAAAGPAAVQGRDGNFYATSVLGGTNDLGTIFQITASGTLTTLYSFDGTVGQYPYGGLILGTDGNFYGTANRGGSAGFGSIYKVTPAGVVTPLHTFTNAGDGTNPAAAPVMGNDGNFYGTTNGFDVTTFHANSTVYKITPAGVLTTIHTLDPATEGSSAGYLVLGADGNFYGEATSGGSTGWGTLFKVTPAGAVTVLHTFNNITDGRQGSTIAQAANGTFYGASYLGGASGAGTIFKMSPTGTFTLLYTLNGTTDGSGVAGSMTLGSDGNFYNVTASQGASSGGTIFKVTPSGAFTKLIDFGGANQGVTPGTGLLQSTNGVFYGSTENGGTGNVGVFYSLSENLSPFISLVTTSGKVGSKVGILGQGFSASSVVKFNGAQATTVTRSGSTFLLATVPAGASSGKVTVKTGATTLTSAQTYLVHNSWTSGAVMPSGVQWPMTGVIGSKIYVVGGYTASAAVANNAIYNTATNTWSSGASFPTAMAQAASAVVNNTLYVFGGSADGGATVSNAVWAYNPTTNSWSAKAAMPTARCSMEAAVANGVIYVIGGYNGSRLNTVESYNPTTDTWTVKTPLLTGKSEISAGLIGSTIVAADGFASGGVTGDNESYNASTNIWTALTADSVHRNGACAGAIGGNLYASDGNDNSNNAFSVMESFNLAANAWTTLATMPQTVTDSGPAVNNGLLYCFGGSSFANAFRGTVFNTVQIYQP